MKVINKTVWRTDHLKSILQKCAEMEFDDGARRKRLRVTVIYTRKGGCSGVAWLNSNTCTVRIANPNGTMTAYETVALDDPRPATCWHAKDSVKTAKVVAVKRPISFDGPGIRELKRQFASVACHEFAHCRGADHRQMPAYYKWTGNWRARVEWAADMPLDMRTEKPAPSPDVVLSAKLAHVVSMRERAETRFRRAKTLLQKWQQREKYYERRRAAMGTA